MTTAPSNLVLTAQSTGLDLITTWTNEDNYDRVRIQYHIGGAWITELEGVARESYLFSTVTQNTQYTVRVAGRKDLIWSDYSNEDSAGCYSDTDDETVTVTESITESAIAGDYVEEAVTVTESVQETGVLADSATETITITASVADAQTIKTTFGYYLADVDGYVYEYGGDYKSDAGSSISATWESKDIDFSDLNPAIADQIKKIHKIRLYYKDLTANATVSVMVSNDSGASWSSRTKTIGTGNNRSKASDFWIRKSGHILRFAVSNASASDEFQWVGLEAFFSVGGEYFQVN